MSPSLQLFFDRFLHARREKQECQLIERTEDGSGPLLVAAQNGHLEIVKALTKVGLCGCVVHVLQSKCVGRSSLPDVTFGNWMN